MKTTHGFDYQVVYKITYNNRKANIWDSNIFLI